MTTRGQVLCVAVVTFGLVLGSRSPGLAGVTTTGSTYSDSNNNFFAGYTADGTITIDGGTQISNSSVYLGYRDGFTGTATVTGPGSAWTNSGYLNVGYIWKGFLNIQAGGLVSNNAGGFISEGTATVTGAGSTWTNNGYLMVGYSGGSDSILNIQGGGQVSNTAGEIGNRSGWLGTVTVSGPGSTWTNSGSLSIGFLGSGTQGSGTLNIQAGGRVSSVGATVPSGSVKVTGPGSTWANTGTISLSGSSTKLTVADGGKVSTQVLNFSGTITIQISGSNMIVLGSATSNGNIGLNGAISFYADSALPEGVYSPISAYPGKTITWHDTSFSYNAFGGTWGGSSPAFTASALSGFGAGSNPLASSGERMLFTDAGSGKQVGASFGSVTAGETFSATLMSQNELSKLSPKLGPTDLVLSGWDFSTTVPANQVMLSYYVGLGYQNLEVWHLNSSGGWAKYTPGLVSSGSNGVVSFTVTGFSGYAVTGDAAPAVVPEPATLALLALGGAGVLGRIGRRRGK